MEIESCKKDVAGIKVLVGDSDLPEIEVSSIRDKDVEVLIIEKEVLVIKKDVLVEKDENDSDESKILTQVVCISNASSSQLLLPYLASYSG